MITRDYQDLNFDLKIKIIKTLIIKKKASFIFIIR